MYIHHRSMRFIASIFFTGFCLSFGLFSCNRSAEQAQTNNNTQTAGIGNPGSIEKASGTKVFTLKSVAAAEGNKRADFAWAEGKSTVKLSELSKGKPVFLNFWATWCPPCRRELPDIVELHKELGSKVVFMGIASENESKAVKSTPLVTSFAQKNNIGYINIVGDEELIAKISTAYGNVEALPTTFIIDKNGVIVDKLVGGRSKEDFLAALKKVM